MAKLETPLAFTGSLGNISAYRMRGSDRIILRRHGGASKKKIKTSPAFANVRRNNQEFGGVTTTSKWILRSLHPLKSLADYNLIGTLNALLKSIQKRDTESKWGQRHVQVSKNPWLLAGFSLNKKYPVDSVLRSPLPLSLSRAERSGWIDIPAWVPGINFTPSPYHPYYSLVAVLGIIPDIVFKEGKYQPASPGYEHPMSSVTLETTPWQPVVAPSEAIRLSLTSTFVPPDEAFSLLLSIGVRYGAIGMGGSIQQVPHAGCAKILAVV